MPPDHRHPRMEFHVSRTVRDLYEFDQSLFSLRGSVILADFHAARLFARKINEHRDLVSFPERAVQAGQINAMGLIDEIRHYVVGVYRRQESPRAMSEALAWLEARLGPEAVEETLSRFADEFPPLAVYRQEVALEAYLGGETEGVSNREILLEELLALWLANANPAFAPFLELFDDEVLRRHTAYLRVMEELQAFFARQPPFGPDGEPLVQMLRRPALEVPHSLGGQLEYMLERWALLLGRYLYRLLRGLDVLREEQKAVFLGPEPARVYQFAHLEPEEERYSTDREWMSRLVLLAKNAYVWLAQLSRQYGREISRLDQVPGEELETLARRGFNGLWLIGLWERSPASQRIKQRMGNPEAVASAYSLFDYRIARDLGGEEALSDLRQRAWRRGIRLASDMVPNHMGIDSPWVMEHPDWFVQLDHSPFPSYTFEGPDLSWHPDVGILLEDHYYDRSDAAVVFKRLDRRSGRERYLYHGNDGTSMPWNDTAQLNYLLPQVREAVIQTILHVARSFPVIRFDAAMTLARRHYQRLWFPEPGSGGAIPSRAEHGLPRQEFERAMPREFWREVVDRVAQEAPDTLLLAEAFWLMEGYFVRTLGMHRVYNSAFMNMLRDERNADYRQLMKNTLEFDPQILKRYVNFMNNPDERTAVEQFGAGDKYFGICTLMATLPGLPMFGHGQVEGLAEKYGMEFRRPYRDEEPDRQLVARHERQIFPLLHRRHLFAGVEDFLLYDLYGDDGQVNEDVFAYSNRLGSERALIIYNNRHAEARGWIRTSAAFAERRDGERALVRRHLGEGLGLDGGDGTFVVFRDHSSGLEYLHAGRELHERGLHVELGAYQAHVFLDFREVRETPDGRYAQLAAYLAGRGVPSVQEAFRELLLQPVLAPFGELLQVDLFRRLMAARLTRPGEASDSALLDEVEGRLGELLRGIKAVTGAAGEEAGLAADIRRRLEVVLALPVPEAGPEGRPAAAARAAVRAHLGEDSARWAVVFGWTLTHRLGRLMGEGETATRSAAWLEEWGLGRLMAPLLQELGRDAEEAWREAGLIQGLVIHQGWFLEDLPAFRLLEVWLAEAGLQRFLGIHRYMDVLWFNHEAFVELLGWMLTLAAVGLDDPQRLGDCHRLMEALRRAEQESDYQVERLLEAARQSPAGR